jgi:hypothetical protein
VHWATPLAIISQTHLVTLPGTDVILKNRRKNLCKNIGGFCSNYILLVLTKNRRKLAKIADDHNIDPWANVMIFVDY